MDFSFEFADREYAEGYETLSGLPGECGNTGPTIMFVFAPEDCTDNGSGEHEFADSMREHSRFKAEADLAECVFREPIIADPEGAKAGLLPGESYEQAVERQDVYRQGAEARNATVDRRWRAVTEVARRAIVASADSRPAIAALVAEPLDERLPEKTVTKIAGTSERAAQLAANTELNSVLGLPSIPNELIDPDIKNAPGLPNRTDEVEHLVHQMENHPETYDRSLINSRRRIDESGISGEERNLVKLRYRFAREAQTLGLMAELTENPPDSPVRDPEMQTSEYRLDSGIRIVVTDEVLDNHPALLEPKKWESRTMIKDRVHEVVIDGQPYILKERKTARHADTKGDAHTDALTSQQEFETAKDLVDLGPAHMEDHEINWERPLGHVEFPNGYQFCLFEKEDISDNRWPKEELTQEILASRDAYQADYELMRDYANQIRDNYGHLLTKGQPEQTAQGSPPDLTFEEYAEIKAEHILVTSSSAVDMAVNNRGYVNSDYTQMSFRVRHGQRPALELVVYDLEYYTYNPHAAALNTRQNAEWIASETKAEIRSHSFAGRRMTVLAASYAILSQIHSSILEHVVQYLDDQ